MLIKTTLTDSVKIYKNFVKIIGIQFLSVFLDITKITDF